MDNNSEVVYLYLDDIIPNRFQPREVFDDQALKELAVSIREHGVIQPIIVRKVDNKYEIIAGERRYKASTMAGLTKIPAIIKNLDDKESSKVALIENLQRRDLTPIEEARTYQKILELEDNMTQEELAATMGKTQSSVSNKLRLLSLPEEVQDALLKEKISERHARSLLNVEDKNEQINLLNRIIEEKMTVREVEKEIKILKGEEVEETTEPVTEVQEEETTEAPTEESGGETAVISENETEAPSEVPTEEANANTSHIPEEVKELDTPSLSDPIIEQTAVEETTEPVTETQEEETTEAPSEMVIPSVDLDSNAVEALANDQQSLDEIVKNVTEKVNKGNQEGFKLEENKEEEKTTPKLDLNKLFNPFSEEGQKNNNSASVVSSPVIGAAGGKDFNEAVKKVKEAVDGLVGEGYNIKVSESDILRTHEIKITIFK